MPTDASGNFEWVPVDPLPNENLTFTILGRESEIMGQVVTNSTGGASDVQIMVPVTILAFKVFSDYNGNGVLDLGEPILRELPYTVAFDNGTVVANDSIPSGQDWGTWWEPVFYPDTNFTVALAIDPGSLLCSVKTNSTAYGSKICPVPPSQISGNVWSDDLCDGTFGFGDTIYSNALLYVYSLPGNTQLGNTTTNSIGSFTFQFLWPLRNKQVKVVLASDSTKSISVTLDGSGNAQNVSVQLVSSGVRGKYFVDVDQDNTYGSNDVPYASVAIDVKFSNGALLGSATTDVNSNFLVNVSNPLPSGTVLSVYTAANPSSAIGTITTDTSGFGCSVIAGPSPPGSGLVKVGNSAFDTSQTICQGSNFTAVITDSVLPGSGQRMLSANFAGATGSACYRKGTAVGPPGWTVEYSTDNGATWSATEPATGCAVTTVRTSAVQNYSGTAGTSSDMIVQKLEVSQLNYMGWLSSPSGTDGNDIIFDTANDRIFTVQHHVDYLKVVCWYKLTGQLCAGWNPAPTWTSTNFGYNVAFSRFVSGTVYNGKLYVWGRLQASNNPAVFCVDISSATPALCATKHYSLAPTLSYSNDEATSAGIRLGNRVGDGGLAAAMIGNPTECPNHLTISICLADTHIDLQPQSHINLL